MNRFKLYRLLRRNNRLAYRRSPAFEQSVVAKVLMMLGGGMFDIYAQLGLLMLVGLSAKTSILMVECAHVRHRSGVSPYRAAMAGLRLRFRAVMMTALSFVIGVLPLLVATGPGAGARRAIGIVTFWGMLAATVLGVILVPPLYVATTRRATRPAPERRPA